MSYSLCSIHYMYTCDDTRKLWLLTHRSQVCSILLSRMYGFLRIARSDASGLDRREFIRCMPPRANPSDILPLTRNQERRPYRYKATQTPQRLLLDQSIQTTMGENDASPPQRMHTEDLQAIIASLQTFFSKENKETSGEVAPPAPPASSSAITFPPPVEPPSRDPANLLPPFTPPHTTNPSYGASSFPLALTFSDIPAATLLAVVTHNLRLGDLYKLDSRLSSYDLDPDDFTVASDGNLQKKKQKALNKDYPTPSSLLVPLDRYFRILTIHLAQSNRLACAAQYFWQYRLHLDICIATYEWVGVKNYHLRFFDHRVEQMRTGIYNSWGETDITLAGQYLYPYTKPAALTRTGKTSPDKPKKAFNPSTPCIKWNVGECPITPCPHK